MPPCRHLQIFRGFQSGACMHACIHACMLCRMFTTIFSHSCKSSVCEVDDWHGSILTVSITLDVQDTILHTNTSRQHRVPSGITATPAQLAKAAMSLHTWTGSPLSLNATSVVLM